MNRLFQTVCICLAAGLGAASAQDVSISGVSRDGRLSWTSVSGTTCRVEVVSSLLDGWSNPWTAAAVPATGAESSASIALSNDVALCRVVSSVRFSELADTNAWVVYDAGMTGGTNCGGFVGGVFDGRYAYFIPYKDSAGLMQGRALRYDTTIVFTNPGAWTAYDARTTGGLDCRGYSGGVFDGRYVYFGDMNTTNNELRYDTTGNFTNPASWSAFNATTVDGLTCWGMQGTCFDGRYVYFVPHNNGAWNGIVLRYDSLGVFTNAAYWHAYNASNTTGLLTIGYSSAVFDGRRVVFVPCINPQVHAQVLTFDTTGTFTNPTSWAAFDATTTGGYVNGGFKGGVFDGRYIYFVPFADFSPILRYDTTAPLTNAASYTSVMRTNVDGIATRGFVGGGFDGRHVYFVPYQYDSSTFHGHVLRYDTQTTFTQTNGWHAFDAGSIGGLNTRGYQGTVFDGRYIYFVPWQDNTNKHARVLRFDSRAPRQRPAGPPSGSFF